MRLYCVRFDDSDVVVVEPGIEIQEEAVNRFADLGADVGGATLAMIPLRIPLVSFGATDAVLEDGRLHTATLGNDGDGKLWFTPEGERDPDSDIPF